MRQVLHGTGFVWGSSDASLVGIKHIGVVAGPRVEEVADSIGDSHHVLGPEGLQEALGCHVVDRALSITAERWWRPIGWGAIARTRRSSIGRAWRGSSIGRRSIGRARRRSPVCRGSIGGAIAVLSSCWRHGGGPSGGWHGHCFGNRHRRRPVLARLVLIFLVAAASGSTDGTHLRRTSVLRACEC